jgi:hypothetical protein
MIVHIIPTRYRSNPTAGGAKKEPEGHQSRTQGKGEAEKNKDELWGKLK